MDLTWEGKSTELKKEVTPGHPERFDLVHRTEKGRPYVVLGGAELDQIGKAWRLASGTYRLTVEARGDGGDVAEAVFEVENLLGLSVREVL